MCRVSPEHVPMLKAFGTFMLMMGIGSLMLKKTYFKGIIVKAESPLDYWVSVGCYFALGIFIWGGLVLC